MEKLVVITGGTKGIGRALVEKFSSAGFSVATCSRNQSQLRQLSEDVSPNRLFGFQADMSRKEEVNAFADKVLALDLPIAALINNAGVFIPGKILEEDESNLEIQLNTNLYSAYYLTRKLMPKMLSQDSSHLFNMGSIAGQFAYPHSGSYSISKFALLGFNKSLREELKETNIKVTSIIPGATLTDSWAGTDLPESRFIKPQDIAEAVWAAFSVSKSAVIEEIVIRPQLGDL